MPVRLIGCFRGFDMRLEKTLALFVVLAGIALVAIVRAPSVHGQRDVDITPSDNDRRADVTIHGDWGDYMRDFGRDLGRLGDRFNFDFDLDGLGSGRRLGVTVEQLTGQLADYFGAKQGLLVTSVTEDSAASRAGLKAGDVITSVDGRSIRTRQDLVIALREARADEVSIAIVRDRKETTLKAKVEASRRTTRRWPL